MYCSTSNEHRKHTTAQHRTTQSIHTKPQSKDVPIRVRQRKRVDRASTAYLQYRMHSTARRNQCAQSRKASTCRSGCDNGSKQTGWREPAQSSVIYTARCALKTNEGIEMCPVYKKVRRHTALARCAKDSPLVSISISTTLLSLRPVFSGAATKNTYFVYLVQLGPKTGTRYIL